MPGRTQTPISSIPMSLRYGFFLPETWGAREEPSTLLMGCSPTPGSRWNHPEKGSGCFEATQEKGSLKNSWWIFSPLIFEVHLVSCLEKWKKETTPFSLCSKRWQNTWTWHVFFGCPLLGVRNRKKSLGKKSFQWLAQLEVVQKIPWQPLDCQGFSWATGQFWNLNQGDNRGYPYNSVPI